MHYHIFYHLDSQQPLCLLIHLDPSSHPQDGVLTDTAQAKLGVEVKEQNVERQLSSQDEQKLKMLKYKIISFHVLNESCMFTLC